MKTDKIYLQKISEAISLIGSFVKGIGYLKFKRDRKTQGAVILQLIILGEEAKKLSASTKTKIQLPWLQIVGFRNKAVHEYYNLDIDIVWKTVSEDLPKVKGEILKYLRKIK